MQLSVVILAAGQGKRMNSDLPKVLQPLAGRPLLAHVIDTARSLSPQDVYVVYGHGGAQVQAALSHEAVDWVLQAEQLGTGHAVMQAMSLIPDDHVVLVLYGDVPLIRTSTLEALVNEAREGALAILSVIQTDPFGYGRIVRGKDGRVTGIVEQKDARGDELAIREVNSGLMAAPAGALRGWLLGLGRDNSQREYYLTDIVKAAVESGHRVEAVESILAGEVMGVNDKRQLAEVEAQLRRDRAAELMRAGATLADPTRIDIRGQVTLGRDVFIDVNVVLAGVVFLGDGVKVGPGCLITDSRIGARTEVNAHSLIERAEVGENCRIGPFARVRPDSTLADDVHVGNFVEIKASEIGSGSKANHLTYIGDARIGSGVNVGAGTVTCNYDGQNKWPTVIGDRAFIGSGSMLVAPVRIGTGATIGAGSSITESTPDDELTLTRARQATIRGWKRPRKFDEAEKTAIIADRMRAAWVEAGTGGDRTGTRDADATRAGDAKARGAKARRSNAVSAQGGGTKAGETRTRSAQIGTAKAGSAKADDTTVRGRQGPKSLRGKKRPGPRGARR